MAPTTPPPAQLVRTRADGLSEVDGPGEAHRRWVEGLGITIEATPWVDVHRVWALSQGSMRYADAFYVAAAERRSTTLITTDARIARSGA